MVEMGVNDVQDMCAISHAGAFYKFGTLSDPGKDFFISMNPHPSCMNLGLWGEAETDLETYLLRRT